MLSSQFFSLSDSRCFLIRRQASLEHLVPSSGKQQQQQQAKREREEKVRPTGEAADTVSMKVLLHKLSYT